MVLLIKSEKRDKGAAIFNGELIMETQALKEIKKKTEILTVEENLELIAHIVGKIRKIRAESVKRRKWSEIYGIAPYPLVGEDAQTWVTRTRHEANTNREKKWQ
jgi:hypothetical protein